MGFGKAFKTVAHLGMSTKTHRRLRRKLGITGKQIKRKLGMRGVNSAKGVSSYDSGSFYGPTGSIVGRY